MRVIYLPGVSGAGHFWDPVAERLPASWEHTFVDWLGLGDVLPSPDVAGFDDLVSMVVERLTELAVLVAQSMGGVVATLVALAQPSLVTHLVSCATSGGVDMTSAVDWRPAYANTWASAPDWVFERPADLSGALPSISQPTLLLWASNDEISPLAVGTRLAELIPKSRLEIVETSEHQFVRDFAEFTAAQIQLHLECS